MVTLVKASRSGASTVLQLPLKYLHPPIGYSNSITLVALEFGDELNQ
jgi:hypothetical protein